MLRILLATFVSSVVAIAVVASAAVLAWPVGADRLSVVAVHFIAFGAVIVFPLAFLGGIPLYCFFKWRGWLTPTAVLLGGTGLALIYPLQALLTNPSDVVSPWHFVVCAAAGCVASMVFVCLSGMNRGRGQL